MNRDEIETKYRKAIKALDGEKRAALKKAKATKGKKAKEIITNIEAEFETRLKELEAQHQKDLKEICGDDNNVKEEEEQQPVKEEENDNDDEEKKKKKKLEKIREKREKQRQIEIQREKDIQNEINNAGPSPRDVEMKQIQNVIDPLNLTIHEIQADGNCLYRSIAKAMNYINNNSVDVKDYQDMRNLTAKVLKENQNDYEPFVEYNNNEDVNDYQSYINQIQYTSTWGGHLEIRALSYGLQIPIHIYSSSSNSSSSSSQPTIIIDARTSITDDDNNNDNNNNNNIIRLSYHLQYYALGEHYNVILPKEES